MNENKANTISVSLLNRKIYSVCCTEMDTLAAFHNALYQMRRRFFETGKSARAKENGIYYGLSGKIAGKLTRHGCEWKKTVGKRTVEAYFAYGNQRGIEFRQPDGTLRARTYFDREHHWLRTEYFAPDDPMRAKVSFKPDDARDAVLRFDYSRDTGKTKQTTLFPVPYAFQTAEQNLQNAQCGEALFLVATDTGDFAYCPREEQQRRIRFLKDSKNATVLLSMGWEVKDGDITPPDPPTVRDPEYIFTGIEDTVQTSLPDETTGILTELFEERDQAAEAQPSEPAPETPQAPAKPQTEADNQPAPAPALNTLGFTEEDAAHILDVLDNILQHPPVPHPVQEPAETGGLTLIRDGTETRYTGEIENGLREGFGRTESPEGITLYEGEYKNDLREGFGAHHYKSGAISYVGDFKADKRDGFGVSFRENDHSLHVSRWKDGKPEGYATLFDPNGAMRFAGKIIDGKKQGAGISIDPDTDTLFIAKYEDNEPVGEGALFAGDGTLLYLGGWKDGKRSGHGTEFDKNGDIIYAGEWKDDAYLNGILYKRVQGEPKDGSN